MGRHTIDNLRLAIEQIEASYQSTWSAYLSIRGNRRREGAVVHSVCELLERASKLAENALEKAEKEFQSELTEVK
jgi:hypothetical protein